MEEIEPLGPEFLLSALLAEVARCGAAGCTWDEVAAHLGILEDANELRLSQEKLETLVLRQDSWLDKLIEHYSN